MDRVVWLLAQRRKAERQAEHLFRSIAFSNFFNAYAKAINKACGRIGSLFQHPFGRIPVLTQSYLIQLVRYIHLNPQKHGLVSDFHKWPYSSYQAFVETLKVCEL